MGLDPLYLFVFLGLFSPGPNVILLTHSGARFGLRASLRHIFGIVLGVGITAGLTGLGIGAALARLPGLELAMKLLAAGWILWMGYTLWRAGGLSDRQADAAPWGILRAALFQWVNPKVWAVALAAASGYGAGLAPVQEAVRLGSAFAGINLFVCLFWCLAGRWMTSFLTTPSAWRVFARVMALGLGASALMVFW